MKQPISIEEEEEEEEAVGFCGDGVVQGYEQCDCGLDYWSV